VAYNHEDSRATFFGENLEEEGRKNNTTWHGDILHEVLLENGLKGLCTVGE